MWCSCSVLAILLLLQYVTTYLAVAWADPNPSLLLSISQLFVGSTLYLHQIMLFSRLSVSGGSLASKRLTARLSLTCCPTRILGSYRVPLHPHCALRFQPADQRSYSSLNNLISRLRRSMSQESHVPTAAAVEVEPVTSTNPLLAVGFSYCVQR